jgi:hypothetical protein
VDPITNEARRLNDCVILVYGMFFKKLIINQQEAAWKDTGLVR